MSVTALVIEDNEHNLYLATILLQAAGFVVRAARDGSEGIAEALRETPDVILLDIQLPVLDGYQVARELRKSPSLTNVPIVAVTSYAMVGDKERCLQAGCTGYIEKPIDPEEFVTQIKRHLSKPQLDQLVPAMFGD